MSADPKVRVNGARPKRATPAASVAVTEFGFLVRPFGFVDECGRTAHWRQGATVEGATLTMLRARGAAVALCPDPAALEIGRNHVGHGR